MIYVIRRKTLMKIAIVFEMRLLEFIGR